MDLIYKKEQVVFLLVDLLTRYFWVLLPFFPVKNGRVVLLGLIG